MAKEQRAAAEKHNDGAENGFAPETIKVLHKTSKIDRAKFEHDVEHPYTKKLKDEIIADGKEKGYVVRFQEYPDKKLVVAWLGQ